MKKMKAIQNLAIFALLFLGLGILALADQPPDNVQGDWTIYSTSIKDGQTVVKHVQIAQYGNRITGYFEGPNQSGPIQGRVNAHHIVFSTVTRTVLTFRGQIYGDNMTGLYGIHGQHAPWQAVRPATAAVAAPPATGVAYTSQPVLAPPVTPAPQPVAQATTESAATGNYPSASGNSGSAPAPLSSDQLDALVAPIALYPDALVAQVLAAATNQDEVAYANDWLAQNRNLTGAALAQAVDQQSWDPSVKALTQFPSVLDNLAHNLSWTSSLGEAFANQQGDVMAAVQVMRAKAQAAGTLQSTSQITVTQPAPNNIVIQPASPQVVYVPQYNPTVVYGAPVVVPFYVPPQLPFASVGLNFGVGVTIGGAYGWGGGFGWGWHAWNVNWGCCGGGGSTTIIYNHNTYINNRISNNGYHPWAGGAAGSQNHAWYGANGTFHPDGNYKPGEDTHYGPNGGYHPNGYFGPDGGWHPDKGTGPSNTPNGGNNGNHGLIGGNGGTEHASADSNGGAVMNGGRGSYSNNGTFHPDPGYKPGEDTHYGPNGGYHPNGYFGPEGGFHPDKGTGPGNTPNGGNNGDHGLIGGNGGAQRNQQSGGQSLGQTRGDNNRIGAEQNRAESNRGRSSTGGRRPQQHAARQHMQHAPAQHHSSGGGGRRR